jgi:hypothetical protein
VHELWRSRHAGSSVSSFYVRQDLPVNTTSVENVANFKYLAATITNQTYIHEEIKSRQGKIKLDEFCLSNDIQNELIW